MSSLSKNGKKIILAAVFTLTALIIIGVMLAGAAHPPKNAAGNAIPQLAGARDAQSAASAPMVPVMAPPSFIERATPSPWIRARQDKDCVKAGGITLICFIHSTLIGREAK
ncbi:hypothetical protein HER14_00945 [Acidithiobacillus thiooxidans]|uniref:hypothetical protein n=1 Tax=Acidithiobacillus thiooxidans TaxID=930 RepID=UPI001C07265B|nr:hypothetical protein [Acidithiobacillus thiooxidans]MBU2749574.1 hypothetical protein [Acidithiobacillus thiooxidans]